MFLYPQNAWIFFMLTLWLEEPEVHAQGGSGRPYPFSPPQMVATVVVLGIAKRCSIIDFPSYSSDVLGKIWPLPIIFIGNQVFGLGGTQKLSLPMFTVLRRFSILMTMIGERIVLGWVHALSFCGLNTRKMFPIRRIFDWLLYHIPTCSHYAQQIILIIGTFLVQICTMSKCDEFSTVARW